MRRKTAPRVRGFFFGRLQAIVVCEALDVVPDLPAERIIFVLVDVGQVSSEHDPLPTNDLDLVLHRLGGADGYLVLCFRHIRPICFAVIPFQCTINAIVAEVAKPIHLDDRSAACFAGWSRHPFSLFVAATSPKRERISSCPEKRSTLVLRGPVRPTSTASVPAASPSSAQTGRVSSGWLQRPARSSAPSSPGAVGILYPTLNIRRLAADVQHRETASPDIAGQERTGREPPGHGSAPT